MKLHALVSGESMVQYGINGSIFSVNLLQTNVFFNIFILYTLQRTKKLKKELLF